MAQNGDYPYYPLTFSHFVLILTTDKLFVEIHERNRQKWLRKDYMNKNFVLSFVLFLVFVTGIKADDGWVIRDPSRPVLVSTPKARALASTGGLTKLPDRLPIGSRETVLDYVVATNSMSPYVSVSLRAFRPDRFEVGIGKFSKGYGSYEDFLRDVREGVEIITKTFSTNSVPAKSNVVVQLNVGYFYNGESQEAVVGNGMALLGQNQVSTFEDLTVDKVMSALDPTNTIQIIQVIVPVPRLKAVDMSVEFRTANTNFTATMSWTEELGARPSSTWTNVGPREWTTPTYLYLRYPVADGSHYTRINLTTKTGETASYTQFGFKVEEPTLGFSSSGIRIGSNPGSDVLVESTSNFQDWKTEFFVKSAQADMTLPVPIKGQNMFFRATAR